jgi:putative PIN family toxin of toxin-antitoxin system
VKVVFDSGVLISALKFGGTPLAALRAPFVRASVAYCSEIDDEVRKALAGKFKWPRADVERAVEEISRDFTWIQLKGALTGICRDPKDDMVLECAVLAGANCIVSGDRDLLVLDGYAGISIVTPRAFVDLMHK